MYNMGNDSFKIESIKSQIKRELTISFGFGFIAMQNLGMYFLPLYHVYRRGSSGEHVSGPFLIVCMVTIAILQYLQMDSNEYLIDEESLKNENTKTTIIFIIASIFGFMSTVIVNYLLGVPKLNLPVKHDPSFLGVLTYHLRLFIPNIIIWLFIARRYFKVNKLKYNIANITKEID